MTWVDKTWRIGPRSFKPSFQAWIRHIRVIPDDWRGDFILDARDDGQFNEHEPFRSHEQLLEFLNRRGACDEAKKGAKKLFTIWNSLRGQQRKLK